MPDMMTGSKDVITKWGWKTAMAAMAPPDFAVPYDAPIATIRDIDDYICT